jgi:hypothetical protein
VQALLAATAAEAAAPAGAGVSGDS